MCRLPHITGNGSVKRIDAYRCRPSNYIHFRAARAIDDDCNRLCFIYIRVHNERATLAGRRERSEDAAAATAQQCYLSPERPVRRHHHFIHNLINTQVSSDKSARTRTGAHTHTHTYDSFGIYDGHGGERVFGVQRYGKMVVALVLCMRESFEDCYCRVINDQRFYSHIVVRTPKPGCTNATHMLDVTHANPLRARVNLWASSVFAFAPVRASQTQLSRMS